jgi:hypothetical protein
LPAKSGKPAPLDKIFALLKSLGMLSPYLPKIWDAPRLKALLDFCLNVDKLLANYGLSCNLGYWILGTRKPIIIFSDVARNYQARLNRG